MEKHIVEMGKKGDKYYYVGINGGSGIDIIDMDTMVHHCHLDIEGSPDRIGWVPELTSEHLNSGYIYLLLYCLLCDNFIIFSKRYYKIIIVKNA
jgi:hypothetical protein